MSAQLNKILQKKADLEADLKQIEETLHEQEIKYLETTAYGNVVKGWDGYLNVNLKQAGRIVKVVAKDQIFSHSSLSAPRIEGGSSNAPMETESSESSGSD
jgi:hypothetical protein